MLVTRDLFSPCASSLRSTAQLFASARLRSSHAIRPSGFQHRSQAPLFTRVAPRMSASALSATARAALRRVLLAVHPDKVSFLGATAQATNTRSLALLNAHVDALESGVTWKLRSTQLSFLISASQSSTAAGATPSAGAGITVGCVLPATGSLQPLFAAFSPYLGGACTAAARSGGAGDEAAGTGAAYSAAEAEDAAGPPEMHDIVAWLQRNFGVASTALSRREALHEAMAAVRAEHLLTTFIVNFDAEHDGNASAEHVHALSAGLRAVPAAVAVLRRLSVALMTQGNSLLHDGSVITSAGVTARLFVSDDGVEWLYLSLSCDVDAYTKLLRALLPRARANASSAAALRAKHASQEAMLSAVAAALGVRVLYPTKCSSALTEHELAAFCGRVLAAAGATTNAKKRIRPCEPRLSLGIRVEHDVARSRGVRDSTVGSISWRGVRRKRGPLLAWCNPGDDCIVVAADCPPHQLACFLSTHGATLDAAYDRVCEPIRRRNAASHAASVALGIITFISSFVLHDDLGIPALQRLTAAAPRIAPLLARSLGRLKQQSALIVVADSDATAWQVSSGGYFHVPASFKLEELERALLELEVKGLLAN